MRIIVHSDGQDCSYKEEQSPQRREDKLNLQPRDLVELLNDVKQVEPE